jgi:hypothetical protein
LQALSAECRVFRYATTPSQVFDVRTLRCLQTGSDSLVRKCSTAVYDFQRSKFITFGSHARAWSIHQLTSTVPRTHDNDVGAGKTPLLLAALLSSTLMQVVMVLCTALHAALWYLTHPERCARDVYTRKRSQQFDLHRF